MPNPVKYLVFSCVILLLCLFSTGVKAGEQKYFPALCFTQEEFYSEYQSGSFEILSTSEVLVFSDGVLHKKVQILTEDSRNSSTILGTWLIDGAVGTGKESYCLTTLQNLGKVHKL